MVKSRRSLSSKQLRSLAKKHGIKTSGKKGTLAGRLRSRGVKVACKSRRKPPRCRSRRSRRKSGSRRRSRKRSRCRFTSDSSFGDDDKESGMTKKQVERLRKRKSGRRKSPKKSRSRRKGSRRKSRSRRKGSRRKSRSRRKGSRRCKHGTKDDGKCRKKPGPKRKSGSRKSPGKLRKGSGPSQARLHERSARHGGRGYGSTKCRADEMYDMRLNYGKGGCRRSCGPGSMYDYQHGRCKDIELNRALRSVSDYKCGVGQYYKNGSCHTVPGSLANVKMADDDKILEIFNTQEPCGKDKDGNQLYRSKATEYECVTQADLQKADSAASEAATKASTDATKASKDAQDKANADAQAAKEPVTKALKAVEDLKETFKKETKELNDKINSERSDENVATQTKELDRRNQLEKLKLDQNARMQKVQADAALADLNYKNSLSKINIEKQKAAMDAAKARGDAQAAQSALNRDTVRTSSPMMPSAPPMTMGRSYGAPMASALDMDAARNTYNARRDELAGRMKLQQADRERNLARAESLAALSEEDREGFGA
jgi:hypothetical protein